MHPPLDLWTWPLINAQDATTSITGIMLLIGEAAVLTVATVTPIPRNIVNGCAAMTTQLLAMVLSIAEELGPVRRAHRCTAGDIPQAPAVFVEVTRPPTVQGQDVWPVAPGNMWRAEHAPVMCRALQGQAAALPRAPAAQSSSNRPAASLALLYNVSRAWCWVVVALEPHSSALRLYDRGEGTVLTVRPADLQAVHLGALSGDGGAALYLQGTVTGSAAVRFRRQSGGDALRLVMAENMGPWLRAFSASRWKVEGDREKFTDAWRRWVEEQFPVGGMLHLPQPPSVPPVRPAATSAAAAKPAPKAAPKPPPQYGSYANIRYVLQHFGGDLATEQRGSKAINVCPWSRLDGAGHCACLMLYI